MIDTFVKKFVNVDKTMKNAFDYDDGNPATFSRAIIVNTEKLNNTMYVSGTASIGPNGETLHKGDFKAQVMETFKNLTSVLHAGNFNWENVVRTTIYLRDIDRDYADFNTLRGEFFKEVGIEKYPASTCIGAKICRSDLLVEIELIAMK